MRVLYFHQHFSTPYGGTGTRSFEFSKALIAKGHNVTVVCGSFDAGHTGITTEYVNGRRSGTVNGINVVEYHLPYSNKQSLVKRTLQFIKFAFFCCREIGRNNPDLVFCTSTPLTIAIPGIIAKVLYRKKFIFEVRDLWPELPVAMGVIRNPIVVSLLKVLEVSAYKIADKVVALSGGMQEGVVKYIDASKTVVISNGCDNYLRHKEDNIPFPVGIAQDDFVAVYSGTHGLANGLDALIDTGLYLQKKGIGNIKLLLIGDGLLKVSLQKELENLV